MLELVLLVEGIIVHRFALTENITCIGRHDDNDIPIDDASVSSFHARIEIKHKAGEQQVWFEDLESTNGSLVNKKRVTHTQLKHGDYVDIGRKQFKFIDPINRAINSDSTVMVDEPSAIELDAEQHSLLQKMGLSRREIQVLQLLTLGKQRKEIAEELSISIHTTSDYVKAIYRKMNVSSRAQAVKLAMQLGVIR